MYETLKSKNITCETDNDEHLFVIAQANTFNIEEILKKQ